MIEKIKIKNFRSIKNQEFSNLGNLVVFVGENSSGKSTVLNAIRILNEKNYSPSINDFRHGTENFEIAVIKELNNNFFLNLLRKFEETLNFDDFILYFERNIENRDRKTKMYISEFKSYIVNQYFNGVNYQKMGIQLSVEKRNEETIHVQYDLVKSNFKKIEMKFDNHNKFLLDAFINDLASINDERKFFEEVNSDEDSITNSVFNLFLNSINDVDTIGIDDILNKEASDLSLHEINELLTHKMNRTSDSFLNSINEKFDKYVDESLEVKWNFEENLKSRIKLRTQFENVHGNPIDFMSTGSGTRSIYLLSLLESFVEQAKSHNNKNGLFLIEEPELYLYPKLERNMGKIIQKISKENQVFTTSHSSGLVSQFKTENVYIVETIGDKGDKFSNFKKMVSNVELIDILGFNGYPVIGKDYIIMVEGVDDIIEYEKIIQKHFPNEFSKCAFIKVNSVKNIEVGVTCQLIKDTFHLNKLFIIIDSDGRKTKKINNQFKEALKHIMDNEELDDLIKNRLYSTENAMNLECFTIDTDFLLENEEINETKLNKFLRENREKISKELRQKESRGIFTAEEIEKINDILNGQSFPDKINILKEKLLHKSMVNIFLNIFNIKDKISDYDSKKQQKVLPVLLNKLNSFFIDL